MRLRKTVPELKDSIGDSINKQISETTEVIKNKTRQHIEEAEKKTYADKAECGE